MRRSPRAILPAALAAVLLLLTLQTASAVDPQATPVTEPESTEVQSQTSMHPSQIIGDPTVEFSHSPSIERLPNAQYFFSIDWDFSNVGFEINDNHVTFMSSLSFQDEGGTRSISRNLVEDAVTGSATFGHGLIQDWGTLQNCEYHEGRIKAELRFHAYNNQTLERLYEAEPYPVDIPCSVEVSPVTPDEPVKVCGPDNDYIGIPDQPEGVSVNEGEWDSGHRSIVYTPSDTWYTFPPGFQTSYPYTDTDGCFAHASFLYVDSMDRLQDHHTDTSVHMSYHISDLLPSGEPADLAMSIKVGESETNATRDITSTSASLYFSASAITGLPKECTEHNGLIPISITAQFTRAIPGTEGVTIWETSEEDTIPCTVLVTPVAPAADAINVCGPENDIISIPTQPDEVIVADTDWENGERTITYTTTADWYEFPEEFETEYTFIDDQPCTATASITGPTTLYQIESGSQLEITGEYDVSSLWPEEDGLKAGIVVAFETYRIGTTYSRGLEIQSPADSFSFTTGFSAGMLAEYCPDPDYNGELEVLIDIVFSQPTGETSSEKVWVYEQTLYIPCTVALTPLAASIDNEICGYIDERIIVPDQVGIAGHSITWDDNVATITYEPKTAYEIVGGPYTLTVTADPCVAELMADPVQIDVCGPNNDEIIIGDIPEGVSAQISDDWLDGEFDIELAAQPGWVLHADQRTTWELVDENTSCDEAPEGTTLVVTFETSDGGSIAGTPYTLYAPVASQVAQEPYREGEIGAGNQIIFEELIAGSYRLVVNAEGYEQIDTVLTVTDGEESQQIRLDVIALQPVETPTPSPTPEPTTEPIASPPSEPTVDPTIAAVSGLPETGTGSGGGFGILALAGLLAAMVLGIIERRRASEP